MEFVHDEADDLADLMGGMNLESAQASKKTKPSKNDSGMDEELPAQKKKIQKKKPKIGCKKSAKHLRY